jgi:RNA polymerase sigma-70 factor (ECF subfamily)
MRPEHVLACLGRGGTVVAASDSAEDALIARAVAGDEAALQRLLLASHDAVAAHIAARLPPDLRAFISPDDVLQDAYCTAFRRIRDFELRRGGGFHTWLVRIAERCLSDVIDAQRCAKRGGGRVPVELQPDQDHSQAIGLLELVAAHSRTPSRSAAEREAVAAVQDALKALSEDQRKAVSLRHLEELSVADVAQRMGRSEGAVHMLCSRGLAALREELGDLSRFLPRLP